MWDNVHLVPEHRVMVIWGEGKLSWRNDKRAQDDGDVPHLSAGFMGEGSAEVVRLLLWELWREPLCEEEERDPERRKGCEKNSSKVRRSTGLRRSSP